MTDELTALETTLVDSLKLDFYTYLTENSIDPEFPPDLPILPSQLKAVLDLKTLSDCAGHACDDSWDFESFVLSTVPDADEMILKPAWAANEFSFDAIDSMYDLFLTWCSENDIDYSGPTGADFDT